MNDHVLNELIRQVIISSDGPAVHFYWHGGEPTLAGTDFFEKAVRSELRMLPAGWMVSNNIQTNGLQLDDRFCAFLSQYGFEVGISMDGTEETHDANRRSVSGRKTWDTVKNNISRLLSYGVEPDLLCTVNSVTAEEPEKVYRALASLGSTWIQFIPVVVRNAEGTVLPLSVKPEQYGEFLCRVFDEWFRTDMGRVDVQIVAELAGMMAGRAPAVCWLNRNCGNVLVVEKDGAVYSCDHFVDKEHFLGNILETSLSDLSEGERQKQFGAEKQSGLTQQCRSCPWLEYCGGGCLKDRFGTSADGEQGHYYLCAGLQMFFSHAVPRLRKLMTEKTASESD